MEVPSAFTGRFREVTCDLVVALSLFTNHIVLDSLSLALKIWGQFCCPLPPSFFFRFRSIFGFRGGAVAGVPVFAT